MQRILDAMTYAPAFVRNGRLDILFANRLGYALYSPVFADPARPANLARFAFLDPRATEFYPDGDDAANTAVALLRTEAGRDPYDRGLSDLVGELSTRSENFRTRWAAHNVRFHRTGAKHFHHPVVGDLDLTFEAMELCADTDFGPSRPLYSHSPSTTIAGTRAEEQPTPHRAAGVNRATPTTASEIMAADHDLLAALNKSV